MSRCPQLARPLAQRLRQPQALPRISTPTIAARNLSGTPNRRGDGNTTTFKADLVDATAPPPPTSAYGGRLEAQWESFLESPYQCFQEARKIIAEDRKEKLAQLEKTMTKIQHIEAKDATVYRDGEKFKTKKLRSLRKYVEELKILADINDPVVKMRFEAGFGDMSKPIYRHLAKKRWDAYDRKIIEQRVRQFHIVPDVLPAFQPVMDVQLYFRRYHISPGALVPSVLSEVPPTLAVQVFDRGERLVTVVVLDSDVPVAETDSFARRLHFLATNLPLGPTTQTLSLAKADPHAQVAVPWLPAFSQKGAPYHRLSVFLLEHADGQPLDAAALRALYDGAARDGFSLKSFRDKFPLRPRGFALFRSLWDEGTRGVMARHGLAGADVEFRPTRVHSLKGPRKARGWEAKRTGPKYRHLWKYTHRIAAPRRKFVR